MKRTAVARPDAVMVTDVRRSQARVGIGSALVAILVFAGCGDSHPSPGVSRHTKPTSTTSTKPRSSSTTTPNPPLETTSTRPTGALPPQVTVLHAGSAGGSGEIQVAWRGVANATGYRVSRASAASGPFTTSADFDVTTGKSTKAPGVRNLYYTNEQGFVYVEEISGAGSDPRRYFRVTAYNTTGEAQPSAVVCGAPTGSPTC